MLAIPGPWCVMCRNTWLSSNARTSYQSIIMEGFMTKKEKYSAYNSLLCLAKSLEKRYTTIDLRNETSVTGKIIEVDGYMNIMLEDAALYESDEKYKYFPVLFIQARNVRNIHIPDNIPIRKTIEQTVTISPKVKEKKRTFKQSRAWKQQMETLKFISEMKKKEKEGQKNMENS